VSDRYDLVVVGAGPGGYVGAIRAAQLGLRTAVVERAEIGGRCLNEACIPAKAVLGAADALDAVRAAPAFGIMGAEARVDFAAVQARRAEVVSTLTRGVAGLLGKRAIELVPGEARVCPGGVAVDGRVLEAGAVVLASGSRRRGLAGVDFGGRVIGTEEAWRLSELPATLAVIGAGPSGVEVASAYARLGAAVTLVEALDQVLPGEDADAARALARGLKGQGVEVLTGARVENVSSSADEVGFDAAGRELTVDWLVIAVGRVPDTEALGLSEAGVATDAQGLVQVDEEQRTSVAGVFAVGDLVAGPALAHKASDEAVVAVEAAAGEATQPVDRDFIPRVTFATPAVASVGLSEAQARARGIDPLIGRVPYGAVGAGTLLGERSGLVKLVADPHTRELLGAHIVGARAPELVQEIVAARTFQAGVSDLARVVHGHPTLSEAVLEAARAADGWLIHG
jgi:dihydrolipoamide dehydrogenase